MTDTDDLRALADGSGIQVAYWNVDGQQITLDDDTLRALLAALDVPAATPEDVRRSLDDVAAARRRVLPPTLVVSSGSPWHLPDGLTDVVLELEDGGSLAVDGDLPDDLPLGWHRLRARAADGSELAATVIAAPARLADPPRCWGWQVQLYGLRSRRSWGIGDADDLRTLAVRSARELGADAVLVNPFHSPTPVLPLQNSPYYPSSRRWYDPLLIAVETIPEYAAAPPDVRATVDALGRAAQALNAVDRIDRDAVWTAKRTALEALFAHVRADELAAYRKSHGDELERYATYCALAEVHGPNWQLWPETLRRPESAAALAARDELAPRVTFFAWTQLLCAEQLPSVQQAALDAGMRVGVIHDLAVGVDPAGADGWALQDVIALRASVGAPPDTYNQLGQNWGLPPWHPQRLAEAGYAPLRDMMRAVLANGGGIRIDHVMGLFRLWWVPRGAAAKDGGYVRYDADAMVAAVTLEAHRAGAIVIGEDLGTVEPHVREAMSARGWLGSEIVWFTHDGNHFRAPEEYREAAAASISTHDLPTAAGMLTGEHIDVRLRLGLFAKNEDEVRAHWRAERDGLLAALVRERCVNAGADTASRVEGLHAFLARVSSLVALVSPYDVIGDLRQPNVPGTLDEYPNWRLPLARARHAGGLEQPVSLEELLDDARVRRVASTLVPHGRAVELP
ncbi:MAG: 4-alpha-glucanotransferase [Frankiaceae bacterium]|nr:4-alpha-glucanotransferase [Frankiaceae bacterium]